MVKLCNLAVMLILSVLLLLLSGVEGRGEEIQRELYGELQNQLNTINHDVESIKARLSGYVNKPKVLGKRCKDCADLYHDGARQSGVYTIHPKDGSGEIEVYCDMVTDGGGWTVFQRRQDGTVDFFRDWSQYKAGFGNLMGEFWIGNANIHRLTQQDNYKLRVDLEDFKHTKAHAVYDTFSLGPETSKYKLTIGPYSGTAVTSDKESSKGDSLTPHNGRPFTTKDRDNDVHSGNCADLRKGAWWYTNCHYSNLNGLYYGKEKAEQSVANGVNWWHFKGHFYSLKRACMMMRPTGFKASNTK